MKPAIAAAFAAALAAPAWASCPASPPLAPAGLADGDQRVDAAWLEQNLAGKSLVFDEGAESFNPDGSYSYSAGGQQWDAPSYVFYDNGVRCIAYSPPRFDYYVVNAGQIVLVNAQGQRFIGRVTD